METEKAPESKLLGIPRPFAGAFVGFLLLQFITLPVEISSVYAYLPINLILIAFGFEFPGRMAVSIFNGAVGFALSPMVGIITIKIISSIPSAFLGWMIASYQNSTRIVGIILLVIYIFISALLGFAMASLAI